MWKLKPPWAGFIGFKYLMGACGTVVTQQALTWHEHAWKCSLLMSAEKHWRFPEQFSRSCRSTVWPLVFLTFGTLNCLFALALSISKITGIQPHRLYLGLNTKRWFGWSNMMLLYTLFNFKDMWKTNYEPRVVCGRFLQLILKPCTIAVIKQ